MTTLFPGRFTARPGPIVLCILDGIGLGRGDVDDAVATARTPSFDWLRANHPWRSLKAHGTAVGLPSDADMGNSEVGHNAMGAGRVFDQGAKLVDEALASGSAFQGDVWRNLRQGATLHLLGLVSDGNVHSHVKHLHALIARAAEDGVKRLRLHALTDGRDVGKRTALTWIRPLERLFTEHRLAGRDYEIASGGGRMTITMDRYEADWPMVARGWRCHVHGAGRPFGSASTAIETLYAEDEQVDDQSLPAFVVVDGRGHAVGTIRDGDSVLLFNFRGDRALEITRAFEEDLFPYFERGDRPNVYYAGMMQYDGDTLRPRNFLVSPPAIDRTVGEALSRAAIRTFACSETQKFGHVTYFFNGNNSLPFDEKLEVWRNIPSDSRPFFERPWMKAAEIADAVVEAIDSRSYGHVRLNFANGDMVGHTGVLEATRVAVEAVDLQLGRLIDAVRRTDGVLLVTADHGNADEMWMRNGETVLRDVTGSPLAKTSHTLNPVPLCVYDPRGALALADVPHAGIASLGATLLGLCGVDPPENYLPGLVRPR